MERCILCNKNLDDKRHDKIEIENSIDNMRHLLFDDEIEYLKNLKLDVCEEHTGLLQNMFKNLFVWIMDNPKEKRASSNCATRVKDIIEKSRGMILPLKNAAC